MKEKFFVNVFLSLPEEQYDLAYAALGDYPFLGIEERFDELMICFNESDWTTEKKAALLSDLANYGIGAKISNEEKIADRNWNEEWEKTIEPVIINERIAIAPEWHRDKVHHPLTIIVNPKMSFGTGYHPTTRMVCRLIEALVKENSVWIDAGTGTGVLAILAAKLGAEKVLAFDNDEWSVENGRENIEQNKVDGIVEIRQDNIFTIELPAADGIAANLYRNLLIPNFEKFHAALKESSGDLVVSGVLKYDVDEIITAALKEGFDHIHTEIEQEWAAIHFKALS